MRRLVRRCLAKLQKVNLLQIIFRDGFQPRDILQKAIAKTDISMKGATWGYARVSDDAQSLDLQLDALRAAGVEPKMIFTDQVSGARLGRPGLDALLEAATAGDNIVVWRLDRLGRSVTHLVQLLEGFRSRGVALRSLTEAIDTSSAAGRMIFNVLAALASYERELIIERVRAGMRAAAARRVHQGRPRSLSFPQRQHAFELRNQGKSLKQIAAVFGVHPATISRSVRIAAEEK